MFLISRRDGGMFSMELYILHEDYFLFHSSFYYQIDQFSN